MAAKTDKALSKLLRDLENLSAGMTSHQAELGDIADYQSEVNAMVTGLGALNQEQEQLKAQLESKSAELKARVKEGKDLRSRLRLMVKGKLGVNDQRLEAFGIKVKSS